VWIITSYEHIASKFSGSRTFIEHLEEIVPYFYSEVGERLRSYVAPPPKLQDGKQIEGDSEDSVSKTAESPVAVSGNADGEVAQKQTEATSSPIADGLPIAAAYIGGGEAAQDIASRETETPYTEKQTTKGPSDETA
jgi:hypothetical protein